MIDVDGVEAVVICDRDGFTIASESREESESDSLIGGISAAIDSSIDRIKKEFGTESNFLNITSIGNKKFAFASNGPSSILTTVAKPSTADTQLRVYSEYIAEKVESIISGIEDVAIEIPEIIKLRSKFKDGILPSGEFSQKLILTGDYQVGKTSLIKRFIDNKFEGNYISTLGVEISKKDINLSSETQIQLMVWDIGGQKNEMQPFRQRFFSGANAAFIVIDRTRPSTLENFKFWHNSIKESVNAKIPIVIIGNKSDLIDDIVVSEFDIKKIADEFGYRYLLTSAKTGENVDDAFIYIAYKFLELV